MYTRTELPNGTILNSEKNQYKIIDFIAKGGQGLVYLAENTNKKYVIKELYPTELKYSFIREGSELKIGELCSDRERDMWAWYKANAKKEQQIYNKIFSSRNLANNDPYFLNSPDFFEENNTVYSVYDTFEGRTIAKFIEDEKNNPDFLKRILGLLCIAAEKLEIIHEKANILHLDISPGNIYVVSNSKKSDYETPYIIDFGSAYELNELKEQKESHRFSISDGYSAPEVRRMAQGLNAQLNYSSDIYSLVAVLYSAIFGETYSDFLGIECHERLEKIKALCENDKQAEKFAEIFNKGLNIDKSKRFTTAAALCDSLLELRELFTGNNADITGILYEMKNFSVRFDKIEADVGEIRNNLKQVKSVLLSDSEEKELNSLFNTVDIILSSKIPDYKKTHGFKGVTLTIHSFISLFKSIETISFDDVNYLFGNETSTITLNENLKKKFGEKYAEKYEFYDSFEANKANNICLRFKNEEKSLSITDMDIKQAYNNLLNAYIISDFDNSYEKFSFEAISRHQTMALMAQVYANTKYFSDFADNQRNYLDDCKKLIARNNHNEHYLSVLFARDFTNIYKEDILDIFALYYDNLYKTDCAYPTFSKKFYEWFCASFEDYGKKALNFIKTYNCYNEYIWSSLLNSFQKGEESGLLSFFNEKILLKPECEDTDKNREFLFASYTIICMLSKNNLLKALLSKKIKTNTDELRYAIDIKIFSKFTENVCWQFKSGKYMEISNRNDFSNSLFPVLKILKSKENFKEAIENIKKIFDEEFLKTIPSPDAKKLYVKNSANDVREKKCSQKYNGQIIDDFLNGSISLDDYFQSEKIIETIKLCKDSELRKTVNMKIAEYAQKQKDFGIYKHIFEYILSLGYDYKDIIVYYLEQYRDFKFEDINKIPKGIECKINLDFSDLATNTYQSKNTCFLLFKSLKNNYIDLNRFVALLKNDASVCNIITTILKNIPKAEWYRIYLKTFTDKMLIPKNFCKFPYRLRFAIVNFIDEKNEYNEEKNVLCDELIQLSDTLSINDRILILLLINELTEKNRRFCDSLLNEIEKYYLSKNTDILIINDFKLSEHLIELYKNEPSKTRYIALCIASKLFGTIFSQLKNKPGPNLLRSRSEDFFVYFQHPYVREFVENQATILFSSSLLNANKERELKSIKLPNKLDLYTFLEKFKLNEVPSIKSNKNGVFVNKIICPIQELGDAWEEENSFCKDYCNREALDEFNTNEIALTEKDENYYVLYGYKEAFYLKQDNIDYSNFSVVCPIFIPDNFYENTTFSDVFGEKEKGEDITTSNFDKIFKEIKVLLCKILNKNEGDFSIISQKCIKEIALEDFKTENFVKRHISFACEIVNNENLKGLFEKYPFVFSKKYNDLQNVKNYLKEEAERKNINLTDF